MAKHVAVIYKVTIPFHCTESDKWYVTNVTFPRNPNFAKHGEIVSGLILL